METTDDDDEWATTDDDDEHDGEWETTDDDDEEHDDDGDEWATTDGDEERGEGDDQYRRARELTDDLMSQWVLEAMVEVARESRRDERRSVKQTKHDMMKTVEAEVLLEELTAIVTQGLRSHEAEGDMKRDGLRIVMRWVRACAQGDERHDRSGGRGGCAIESGAGGAPSAVEMRAEEVKSVETGNESSARWAKFWESVCDIGVHVDVGENPRVIRAGVALCQRRWRGSRGHRYLVRLRASGRAYRERG